nr:ASCH domain-containing protein [Streptomyces chartreusis]
MWPRINDLRAMELGTPDDFRTELNSLVLCGKKTATTGLLTEYIKEGEILEHAGERLALLDVRGTQVATIEITDVQLLNFIDVSWEHVIAEGEGDVSLDGWRVAHTRYWRRLGTIVEDSTQVVCLMFRLI